MPREAQSVFGEIVASEQMRYVMSPKEARENIPLAQPRMGQTGCECRGRRRDEIEIHALGNDAKIGFKYNLPSALVYGVSAGLSVTTSNIRKSHRRTRPSLP